MTRPSPPDDWSTTGRDPAVGGSDAGARVIDLATPEWCWAQLRQATRGTLAAAGGRGRPSLTVEYDLDGHLVTVAVRPRDEAAYLLADREVTLGLSGHDRDGRRWVVRASGVAVLGLLPVGTSTLDACRRSHPAHGVLVHPDDALVVPVDRVRGYHETLLATDHGPAAGA